MKRFAVNVATSRLPEAEEGERPLLGRKTVRHKRRSDESHSRQLLRSSPLSLNLTRG